MMSKPQPIDKSTSDDNRSSIIPILLTLSDTTWRIAVPTLGLAVLGLWGDLHFGSKPWLTLIGTTIGFGFATLLIRRQIKDLS
jgi:F0F1-type ATP synthase assembly protein I